MKLQLTVLVIFSLVALSRQGVDNNEVEVEDVSPLEEATKAIFQEDNVKNLGGMVSSFLQSEGAKNIGDMLLGATTGNNNDATSQILAGIGNILAQNAGGGGAGGGLNEAFIGSMLGMLNQQNSHSKDSSKNSNDNDFDMGSILNLLGGLMNNGGQGGGFNQDNLLSYLPMVMSTINSFMGPEAHEREEDHKRHSWLMPPVLEKIHILFDHFVNSELGKSVINHLGGEKIVKIFSDDEGKFSYAKFIELLENHSFRKHWIRMVTQRVAEVVSYFADPYTQKRVLQTVQFFVNTFLKGQGFPSGAIFNPDRPVESISNMINHLSKRFLNQKFNAKMYVKPTVQYFQELFQLAQSKGIVGRAIDSGKLSDKLADTINLDIIEPIIRVNRAVKFAKKHKKCDKYVVCLVNQDVINEDTNLPGLKKLLGRGSSLLMSWFLSSNTGTSMIVYYNLIMNDDNCKAYYHDECHDFHLEEIRVTTEYVHNEL